MHTIIVIGLIYLAVRALLRSGAKRAADRAMAARFVPRPITCVIHAATPAKIDWQQARHDAREKQEAADKIAYWRRIEITRRLPRWYN